MRMKKKRVMHWISFLLITGIGICMIYPLVWMFFASFKTNHEINLAARLLPESFDWSGFIKGWQSSGQYTFTDFFLNTFMLVIPTVLFTVISCTVTAYGFARFSFKGNKLLFGVMLSTLMVPNAVLIIPRYLLFRDFGWLDSYMPFWMPALFACYPFFIYQEVQFLRGIPRELDEAAKIDGCNSFQIFIRILLPILKPSMISVCIFQTIWVWNDFMMPSMVLRLREDRTLPLFQYAFQGEYATNYPLVFAAFVMAMIPIMIFYCIMQKNIIEGMMSGAVKG